MHRFRGRIGRTLRAVGAGTIRINISYAGELFGRLRLSPISSACALGSGGACLSSTVSRSSRVMSSVGSLRRLTTSSIGIASNEGISGTLGT